MIPTCRFLLTLVCAVLFAPAVFAQSSGTVTGQITDSGGGAVPNAKVQIVAVETGVSHVTTSNAEGYYTAASLPPVNYVVTAELAGFEKVSSAPFKLDTTATARVDLVLRPAGDKQVVEVTAAPPALQTENSMVGDTVSRKEIDSLPLEGRNILELALTVPGVMGSMGSDEGGIMQGAVDPGSGLVISGGRPQSSSFLTDGSSTTSAGIGRATVTFSPDTVQEFKVITSTFSAQYGASGGGIISTVSKSGTDEYRGSAFWFQRNPDLVARRFNEPIPSQLRRNEAGITMGGPIRIPKLYNGLHRTFFFASFEPKRWTDGMVNYDRVPTAEERNGDFRNTWAPSGQPVPLIYQQVTCYPSESDCKQLAALNRASTTAVYPLFSANDPDPTKRGHVIPRQYFDPTSLKLLSLVPLPNMPFDANGNNYFGIRGVNGTDNRYNLKIDHNISALNRLSARYSVIPNTADRYRLLKNDYFFSYPGDHNVTRQALLSDTHIISPRIVNEFRASYTFADYSRIAPGDSTTKNYTRDMFGLPNFTNWGMPYIYIMTDWVTIGLDTSNLSMGKWNENHYQASNDVTMVFGRHTIIAGADVRLPQMNVKNDGLPEACCPRYRFDTRLTQSGNANIPTGAGGIAFASFLVGVPNGTNSVNMRDVIGAYYYRWRVGAAFVQDDVKLTPNLTLNLGVRWQYNSPRAEKNNRQASIDLDHPVPLTNAAGQVTAYTFNYVFTGFSGSRYLEPAHRRNFEPRFGFAWTPNVLLAGRKRLVLRGGYGISHALTSGRGRNAIPEFGTGTSGTWDYTQWTGTRAAPQTQSVNPDFLISMGRNVPVIHTDPNVFLVPAKGILCAGCVPKDARVPSGDLLVFVKNNSVPYVQSWSLTTQLDLGRSMVLSLGYQGQKGTHLYSPRININIPDQKQYEALLNAGGDPLQTVPDPFGRVNTAGNLLTVTLQDLMRPYPTTGNLVVVGMTNGLSIYNAGTVSVERRFRGSLGFRFNYTWAKSIDTNSDNLLETSSFPWGPGRVQDPLDLKANRSVSSFDSRHRFNFTMNSELPIGRGRALLGNANRLVNQLVSGWNFNAVASLYSGFPFAPELGDANGIALGSTGQQRVFPDIVLGVPVKNPRWNRSVANTIPYFNPEAFARPAFGHTGNAARTLDWARLPWTPTLNTSIGRNIYPFDNRKRYLQLRGEFFNALNHATFSMYSFGGRPIFNTAPPVTRTGLSLAGPIPYYFGALANSFPAGSRQAVLAQYYNPGFGGFRTSSNGPGRIIQIALKLYF